VLAHRSEHSIGESDEQLDAALARLGLDELAAPLLAELAEDQRRALSMAPSSVQRPIIAPRHNR